MRSIAVGLFLVIAYFGMALWRGGADFAFFVPNFRDAIVLCTWAASCFAFIWFVAGRPSLRD